VIARNIGIEVVRGIDLMTAGDIDLESRRDWPSDSKRYWPSYNNIITLLPFFIEMLQYDWLWSGHMIIRDVLHPNKAQTRTCTCLHDDFRCKQSMA
jgi:hypothetical protein